MNTILVVDDNAAIRMVISDFLSLAFEQINVLQAEDGEVGMSLIEAEHPDLILLDAEMPNMNGYEVAKQIRTEERTKEIPIIAISSGAANNPIVSGLRALAEASLPKPFTPDELIQVVHDVWGQRCLSV